MERLKNWSKMRRYSIQGLLLLLIVTLLQSCFSVRKDYSGLFVSRFVYGKDSLMSYGYRSKGNYIILQDKNEIIPIMKETYFPMHMKLGSGDTIFYKPTGKIIPNKKISNMFDNSSCDKTIGFNLIHHYSKDSAIVRTGRYWTSNNFFKVKDTVYLVFQCDIEGVKYDLDKTIGWSCVDSSEYNIANMNSEEKLNIPSKKTLLFRRLNSISIYNLDYLILGNDSISRLKDDFMLRFPEYLGAEYD